MCFAFSSPSMIDRRAWHVNPEDLGVEASADHNPSAPLPASSPGTAPSPGHRKRGLQMRPGGIRWRCPGQKREGVMTSTTHPMQGPSLARTPAGERLDGLLLQRLAARLGPAALRYALGRSTWAAPAAVATLRFRDRRALIGLLVDPEVHFGDAYADGRIEIEGDLVRAIEAAYRALENGGEAVPSPASRRGPGSRRAARAPTSTTTTTSATTSTRCGSTTSSSTPARTSSPRDPARGGAAREDGPRVPQARAAAGRDA